MDDESTLRGLLATLIEENIELRGLLADMYRVALMSQTHAPDEIRKIYGDMTESYERARRLLESPPGQGKPPVNH